MSVIQLPRRERTPDRPGPGPLRAGHLQKLDLTVRRRVDGILIGDHRATALGEGTELAQVRPYVIGDDVRRIDWNVTARTGRRMCARTSPSERRTPGSCSTRRLR